MSMWEVLLSQRLVLENVLRELSIRFHYLSVQWRFSSYKAEACIQLLAVSNQPTPCSCSGPCLPLQENGHGPHPCHLPHTVPEEDTAP